MLHGAAADVKIARQRERRMTDLKENAIKRLRAMQTQQRELLRKWESGNMKLRSRKPGEREKDITEETKADMRRLIGEYQTLIEKIEASE